MGGKSRKTGGISLKLIQKIANRTNTGKSCGTKKNQSKQRLGLSENSTDDKGSS